MLVDGWWQWRRVWILWKRQREFPVGKISVHAPLIMNSSVWAAATPLRLTLSILAALTQFAKTLLWVTSSWVIVLLLWTLSQVRLPRQLTYLVQCDVLRWERDCIRWAHLSFPFFSKPNLTHCSKILSWTRATLWILTQVEVNLPCCWHRTMEEPGFRPRDISITEPLPLHVS